MISKRISKIKRARLMGFRARARRNKRRRHKAS